MIVSVIVDVNQKVIDKTFDYKVPLTLEEVIEVGQRIKVPFGHRVIYGYVLELKQDSNIKDLKEVIEIIDLVPALTKELLSLATFMHEVSSSTKIAVLNTMLPSALKGKYARYLLLNSELEEVKKFLNYKEKVLYDEYYLHKKKTKEYLLQDQLIIYHETKQASNKKFVDYVVLVKDHVVRGKKQRLVLDCLLEQHIMLKSDLYEQASCNSATLKPLIEKGFIKIEQREEYREITHHYDIEDKQISFTEEQQTVFDELKQSLNKNDVFLLHGVTGSGKTEIYLNIIEEVLKQDKEAILLVPEISLTPQMVSRVKGRFGSNVALLHSGLSIGEKYDEWRKIIKKKARVCVYQK